MMCNECWTQALVCAPVREKEIVFRVFPHLRACAPPAVAAGRLRSRPRTSIGRLSHRWNTSHHARLGLQRGWGRVTHVHRALSPTWLKRNPPETARLHPSPSPLLTLHHPSSATVLPPPHLPVRTRPVRYQRPRSPSAAARGPPESRAERGAGAAVDPRTKDRNDPSRDDLGWLGWPPHSQTELVRYKVH